MEGSLTMDRRSFLKTLCAVAGVSLVPSIGAYVVAPEPVWVIEEMDFGRDIAVAADFGGGVRHAVHITDWNINRDESIQLCKQALRQWYVEKRMKVA